MPRHIILKLSKAKDKERLLKAAQEKQLVIYKGILLRLQAVFSAETAGQRESSTTKNTARLSFRFEAAIKNFLDKQKIKNFMTTKQALQEVLKELLQV